LTKEKIGLAFSRAAATYDNASDFQKETARWLIQRIREDGVCTGRALDIGMGTGRITQELASLFKGAVFGCDLAWGMVSFSKANCTGIAPTQADMENLPYRSGVFDIVFSNIVHQWGHDFRSAVSELRRVLKNGGRFYFSILTENSLHELYKSLESVTGRDYKRGLFPAPGDVRSGLINSGFGLDWFEEKALKRYYAGSLELIKRLKDIGAGRISAENIFGMGQKGLFFRMLEEYDRCFGDGARVFATYNVALGCAIKI
jgi:malonyl-CoA O-methyltransferase